MANQIGDFAPYGTILPRMSTDAPAHTDAIRPGPFPFRTLTSADGKIVLHIYNRDDAFAQRVLAAAQQDALHPITDTLGYGLKSTVDIYAYTSRADFLKGANVDNPAETGAYTDVVSSAIYMPILSLTGEEITNYLPHELTHVVFHQNSDDGGLAEHDFRFFPNWLDEGLATFDEPDGSADVGDLQYAVRYAIAHDRFVNLLTDFTNDYIPDPTANYIAYAESRAFMKYLWNAYGGAAFHQFLTRVKSGDINTAAMRAFGADLPTLYANWRIAIGVGAKTSFIPQGQVSQAPVTPVPFTQGALPPTASSTRYLPVAGGGSFTDNSFIAMLELLATLGAAWWFLRLARQEPRTPPAPASNDAPPVTFGYGSRMAPVTPNAEAPALEFASSAVLVATKPAEPVADAEATQAEPAQTPLTDWRDILWYIAPLPAMFLGGLLVVAIDPNHEWHSGFLAAAVVALAALALLLRRQQLGNLDAPATTFTRTALLALIIAMVVADCGAAVAGKAQSDAQLRRGAYAIAAQTLQHAGGSAADLAHIHTQWAQVAEAKHDYATAYAQYIAALQLDTYSRQAQANRDALARVVQAWAQGETQALQFPQAAQLYAKALHVAQCNGSCHQTLLARAGDLYLTWAGALLASGDTKTALAQLQALVKLYPATDAAKAAQLVLHPTGDLYQAALQAGDQGHEAAKDLLLRLVVAQQSQSAQARLAAETPVLVTGSLRSKAAPQRTASAHLYFIAFITHASATITDSQYFDDDNSLFKISVVTKIDGSFAAQLPPGYWYVPVWEDDAQKNNMNQPADSTFVVHPQSFTALDLGVVWGR